MAAIHKLTVPKLGMTMEEGTLVSWLVEVGTPLKTGDDVAEIATDKIVNTVEVSQPGVLRRKLARDGDVLPVGAIIGVLAEASVGEEEIDAFLAAEGTPLFPLSEQNLSIPKTSEPSGISKQPLSNMRAAVARTVTLSWSTVPHIYLTVKIATAKAERLYHSAKAPGDLFTFSDVLIKAIAMVAPQFPFINGTFTDEGILLHESVNMAIAVGLDDGVVLPVVHGCEKLSLREIGSASHALIDRAQAGTLSAEELVGATISISNMGRLGIDKFTAIVPPGQSAILAIGSIEEIASVQDGAIVPKRIVQITLCCDHRIVDGAYGARFLAQLKKTLEEPAPLFLELPQLAHAGKD